MGHLFPVWGFSSRIEKIPRALDGGNAARLAQKLLFAGSGPRGGDRFEAIGGKAEVAGLSRARLQHRRRACAAGSGNRVRSEIDDGMEPLSQTVCSQHLGAGGVGLLALRGFDEPILRPVNYALHRETLIIRTGEGRIFEAARRAESASFAISQIDRLEHTGWSVVVTGRLGLRSASEGVDDLPLRPWVRAEKNHLVELSLDRISGRRIAQVAHVRE